MQLFLALLAVVLGATAQHDCAAILEAAGASERYPGVVAHGIHSLHLEALRQFKADISPNNGIPTVNMNLASDEPILRNVPEAEESCFKTSAMRATDRTLSHMDERNYDVKEYDGLERVVHALHMEEIWNSALIQYKNISLNPPNSKVCHCARDIENNGVMKMLRFIALQIREPELMYGKHVTINGRSYSWDGNVYSYGFLPQKAADDALLNAQDAIPPLTNEAGWRAWKDLMMSMKDSDDYELALYLHCALNSNSGGSGTCFCGLSASGKSCVLTMNTCLKGSPACLGEAPSCSTCQCI